MSIRIYALAKDLDIDSKDLVDACTKAGISGKGSALASLDDEEVVKVKTFLDGPKAPVPQGAEPPSTPDRPQRPEGAASPDKIRVIQSPSKKESDSKEVPAFPKAPPLQVETPAAEVEAVEVEEPVDVVAPSKEDDTETMAPIGDAPMRPGEDPAVPVRPDLPPPEPKKPKAGKQQFDVQLSFLRFLAKTKTKRYWSEDLTRRSKVWSMLFRGKNSSQTYSRTARSR